MPAERKSMSLHDTRFRADIVWLLLNGKTEDALERMAKFYHVAVPRIKVGLPKGRTKTALACYTPKDKTISVLNSDALLNPFVVLHEFYHHMRIGVDKIHRGTEKNATRFAEGFVESYKSIARIRLSNRG